MTHTQRLALIACIAATAQDARSEAPAPCFGPLEAPKVTVTVTPATPKAKAKPTPTPDTFGTYLGLIRQAQRLGECSFYSDMLVSQIRFDPEDIEGLPEARDLARCLKQAKMLGHL